MKSNLLTINNKRLLETIRVSATIGTTENGGLSRLALSNEDKEMRDIFTKWMQEEGLKVRIDDFGNMYGRREGRLKEAPVVAIGSHLDTQPCGGKFDGILGVLASLEVIRTLNEHQIETDYPIEIVNFTNEEGARFPIPMLGSGGITDIFTKEYIYNLADNEGVTFYEALKEINYEGDAKNRLSNVKDFIELHIEQGPIMHEKDISIGAVEGIQGMTWFNIVVTGKTNHAGPTPMENRRDALVSAAKMIVRVNEETKKMDGVKTTIGRVEVRPNVTNVIPGEVFFSLDVRHQSDTTREKAIEYLLTELDKISQEDEMSLTVTKTWDSNAVDFSLEVIDAIEEASKEFDYSSMRLYSGPGHDSKYMAAIANTGMIFVKSIDGISHNEAELTLDEDLVKGTNVLLSVVNRLANK